MPFFFHWSPTVIIERPTGKIEVLENGIIHNQYDPGTTILGEHAREEMPLFEEIAQGFGGRLLLLNDFSGNVSADREARAVYGNYSNPNAYVAFVFGNLFVKMGFDFIQKVHGGMNVTRETFRDLDPAITWLEQFTL